MEPHIQHAQRKDAVFGEDADMTLEWHAFLAFRNGQPGVVGRVEAVDRDQIRLTRIDLDGSCRGGVEICVSWDEVHCIAVCGPDRDQDLFNLLQDQTPS